MAVVYDSSFYDMIRPGVQRSASALVPWLLDALAAHGFHPETVVDVGCGEGWWAAEFAAHGLSVSGVDGGDGGAAIPGSYTVADLNVTLPPVAADLVLTLEVAEHLLPGRAAGFVADLCAVAPVVVFSAAIPRQGGHGHVNEQWPGYWADLFAAAGYDVTGDLRYGIWDDDRVEHWYRQNLLVAWRPGVCSLNPARPLPLVHPKLWAAFR